MNRSDRVDTSAIEAERDLIRRAQGGDQKAFAELASGARSRMWAVCLSITGNRHDAEDAMQNALTALWKNLPRFVPKARFSTWAYRVASNAALQIVRARRDTPDAEAGFDEPSTDSPVDSQVTSAVVMRRALDELPPESREVIVLREYAGLSYQEIADHQKVGVQTVKSRINRGRTKLRDALESAGVTHA